MPDVPPQQEPPASETVARWLRVLADAVEGDPALAARLAEVTNVTTPTTPEAALLMPPAPESVSSPPVPEIERDSVPEVVPSSSLHENVLDAVPPPSSVPESVPSPPAPEPPALKHRRRSSRYGPPIVAGRATGMGVGVPDPIALYASDGEAGLRAKLDSLRAGSLRAIIRTHGMDPDGRLPKEATERRMVTLILAAAKRAQPDATSEPTPKRGTKKRG